MSCDGFRPEDKVTSIAELNETYEEEMWTQDWLDMYYRYQDMDDVPERRSICLQLKALWAEYMARETEESSP